MGRKPRRVANLLRGPNGRITGAKRKSLWRSVKRAATSRGDGPEPLAKRRRKEGAPHKKKQVRHALGPRAVHAAASHEPPRPDGQGRSSTRG